MDSPTDSFDDSPPQIHAFAPTHSPADLHPQPSAGRPAAAFRPPGFPLIHHLLQSGGAARRSGGQLTANLSAHRHLEGRHLEEDRDGDGQAERGIGEGEGVMEGEDSMLAVKKRHSDAGLVAKWSQDACKGKRMKLESRAGDGEAEAGGGRREGGKGGKRREREELKEQLEEARERLQALQERVWRAFGEKHMAEEKGDRGGGDGGEDEDVGMMDEEDVARGIYDDEDEIDGGEMQKEAFSLLSVSPFGSFHTPGKERQKYGDGGMERGGGGGGRLHLEDMMEGEGLWLDCGGVVRGDYLGIEDEGDEGGQKFAQALKLELGSAVARVIDRVLRLYTEATDLTPSSPPATISFLPSDAESSADGEKGVWVGLLARGRGEDKPRGNEEKTGARDGEREERLRRTSNGGSLPPGRPHRTQAPDPAVPLAVQRSPDIQKAHPLLGPPLSAHPNLSLHHPSLPRPPSLSHPLLLPPASQPKDPSSSFHPSSTSSSSSTSSFPAPPPPPPHPLALPLPLLHYSMQQLFSRSLHHPHLPHLPPFRKDYLSCEPFLEFSSHPSFPPLPLLGHLDPSLARHAHGGREKERGMRGDGGMRGGMDGGEFYLTAGGISFSRQRGEEGGRDMCLYMNVWMRASP